MKAHLSKAQEDVLAGEPTCIDGDAYSSESIALCADSGLEFPAMLDKAPDLRIQQARDIESSCDDEVVP